MKRSPELTRDEYGRLFGQGADPTFPPCTCGMWRSRENFPQHHITCERWTSPAVLSSLSGVLPEPALIIDDDQARDFITCEGVKGLAEKAVCLVREVFPQLRSATLELSRDPEEAAEWVVLRVTSAAPRADVARAYRQYVRRWVREAPPGKRHLVRLAYTGV